MQRALRFLIFIGFIIWMFFLFEQYLPKDLSLYRVDDATTSARCQKYGDMIEEERALGYGDRLKQLFQGCW